MKPKRIGEAMDAHAGICYGWDGYSGCVAKWAAWYRAWLCPAQKLVVGDGANAKAVIRKFGLAMRGHNPTETIGGNGSDAEYILKVEGGYLYWKAVDDTTIYVLSGHDIACAIVDAPEYEYEELDDIDAADLEAAKRRVVANV